MNVALIATPAQSYQKKFKSSRSGLPDGIFSNQKSNFWVNFGAVKEVGKFYGH
jgi:hypothetical protein